MGTSGFLPYYTTVQAHGVFHQPAGLRRRHGRQFRGRHDLADVMGVHTQAILVTKVIDGTTGTNPGDVPGVGSVFNVMYENSDTTYVLYSSLTDPYGDVVSNIKVDGATVTNINTFPLNILDASAPPPVKRLPIAGGYSVLPTTALTPTGVNGLPPRRSRSRGISSSASTTRPAFSAGRSRPTSPPSGTCTATTAKPSSSPR